MSALLFTAIVHGLFTWMPVPPPLQQAGHNDWRIISSVQFIQPSMTKTPTPTVDKEVNKPPAEQLQLREKPQPQVKPEAITKPIPEITKPITPTKETPQQKVIEFSEAQPIEETQQTEKIAEAEAITEQLAATTEQPLDTTKQLNNLTAALTNQPPGIPQAEYRSQIIELINANKSYPNTARRRGIQGNVDISFTVTNDGSVINLECHGDAKILSRSACDAIKKALPFPAPEKQPLQLSFVMDYVLR